MIHLAGTGLAMEELGSSRGPHGHAAAASRKRQTGTVSPGKRTVRYKTYSKDEDPLISAKVCRALK